MPWGRVARRWVRWGGTAGAAAGAIAVGAYSVLRAEARLARRRIGLIDHPVPDPSGRYTGRHGPSAGEPVRLLVLGDSAAAGYGAHEPGETFGAALATSLAVRLDRPVDLRSVAVTGARTSDLVDQLDAALALEPDRSPADRFDAAAAIIGANDLTHGVRRTAAARQLRHAVERLRGLEMVVVVGTCPDLGTVRPFPQPLRRIARTLSRRLAAAQAHAVTSAGGVAVALGSLLGPEFAAAPTEMFGPDRFHPSPTGYRRCAEAMVPDLVDGLAGVSRRR